jgi:hypothetical protein
MKNTAGFILFAAVVLIVLFFLSSGKKPPFIPVDARHQSIAGDSGCIACHAPGKLAPLKASHPPKEQCLTCHKATR